MSKLNKIFGWLIKSLLVFMFLVVVVMVFTPSLINLEMVKKNIREKISKDVGGQITYQSLKLSYFPRPHVKIRKAEIKIPNSFTIDIEWMRIYPKILPLFRGSLEFAVVRLDYANYFMKLPEIKQSTDRQPGQVFSFDDLIGALSRGLRGLPEFKLPDLNLRIKNGKVNLVDPFGRIFKLREVQAAYVRSQDKLDFNIKCKSNLWEQVDIYGSLDPSDFKGLGHVQLSRFRPQTLIAYLFPDTALQVNNANVTIDFTSDGSGSIKADVSGAVPLLELNYGKEKMAIKGCRIKGTLAVDKQKARVDLTELELDYPKLKFSGMFAYNEKPGIKQLSLEGSQIDADSVRLAALKLAGESEIVQILFNVIRGGHVPWMTARIEGQTIADFAKMDNIVIEGRMIRGKIYIPGAELDLTDVFGDAVIAGGILRGNKLKARYGNSHGQGGSLVLGLNNNLEPFHLNIDVTADLSQLPPVLHRIITNKEFRSELARVKEVQGTATGSLVLEDNLANLGARVEVSEADFTALYNRLPYPIKMKGGHFVYEEAKIALQNFNAEIGNSSFAQLSATIDWNKTPSLEAKTRTAKFDIGQVYSWLKFLDSFKKKLANLSSLAGDVSAQNLIIRGPMFSPQNWHFQSRGMINKLVMISQHLPHELLINHGRFAWQGSQFDFVDVDATMGNSSATAISGYTNWKKKPVLSVQSGRSVLFAEDINALAFSAKNGAAFHSRFYPLKGTLAFDRMAYKGPVFGEPQQQIEFSADINQIVLSSKGLPVSLYVNSGQFSWSKNRLSFKRLSAKMGKSQIDRFSAEFDMAGETSFMLTCKSANLFAGDIYPLLASFEKYQPASGAFSVTDGMLTISDAALKGPLNAPTKWHYDLKATLQNIALDSEALGDPLTINYGSLGLSTKNSSKTTHKQVDIQTTKLSWGDNCLILSGEMGLSKQETLLKLNVDAEDLAWDQIKTVLEYIAKKKTAPDRRAGAYNFRGTIHARSDSFIWESYTVHPLEAEITFKPDEVVVAVSRADICGVSFRGLLNLSDQTLDIYLVPTVANYKLASTLSCLTAKQNLATGTYNLSGEILAKAKPEAVTRSVTGKLTFSAKDGRIYRFGLLAKLLSILNVTEIYRGEIPDLTGEGFAYHSMSASAKLQGSKIIMEECSIDGTSMGIACEGDIDLVNQKMDLLILVAPFKTVDRIVEILPLIGGIMGGKLISIPFRAKGDLDDPDVYALPPTAVGSGILGILERTLKLPITIIQPVISGVKGGKPRPSKIPEESPR